MTGQPSPDDACPGCGLRPPAWWRGAVEPDRPLRASAACWGLHAELVGFELQHLVALGRLHQLTVDAYGAQHAGPPHGACPAGVGAPVHGGPAGSARTAAWWR
ncbi:MAG: DUF5946 family protein [Candidatus Limnocylindrales bacterium]